MLLLMSFKDWLSVLVRTNFTFLLLNVFIICTQICVSSTAVIFLFYISGLFLARVFFTILQIYRFNNYAMKNFCFAIHGLKLRQQSG